MALTKISFSNLILHPWSFKTIDGKKITLSRDERIKSIAMLIIGLPLAFVGGPLLFYTYTTICKKRQIRKLEHLDGNFSNVGNWFSEVAARIAGRNIEKIAGLLPKYASDLRALHPLSKKIKSLLEQAKKTKDEPALRELLQELGNSLRKLHAHNSEIENRLNLFRQTSKCNTKAQEKIDPAQQELEDYQRLEADAYTDMAEMVDSLPIHPGDLENELKLLKGIPYGQQIDRFRKILKTQFIIHNVTGDGACGPRSLSNGIWPKLLEWRHQHEDQTHPEEEALALRLRNEVVDYMEENVNNVKNNKKRNADGTEAIDYRNVCCDNDVDDLDTHFFQTYTKDMRKKSTWFGEQEMKAAGHKYGVKENVNVLIFSPDSVEVKNNRLYPLDEYRSGNPRGRKIFLFHSGGHYEVMSPRVGYTQIAAPKPAAGRERS